MDIIDLLRVLRSLVQDPKRVNCIVDDTIWTPFGTITLGCTGACVIINFRNGTSTSVDTLEYEKQIKELLEEIKKSALEYSINALMESL